MTINITVPASASNAEPASEIEKHPDAESTGADFSALLFLMLATPQVQPATFQSGVAQASPVLGDNCGQDLCAGADSLVLSSEDPLDPNTFANGAAALQASPVGAVPVEHPDAALQIADQTTLVPTNTLAQPPSEASDSLAAAAQANSLTAEPGAAKVDANSALNLLYQQRTNAAENVHLEARAEDNNDNTLPSHTDGRTVVRDHRAQNIVPLAGAEQPSSAGMDDRHEKEFLEPHQGKLDHPLQAAQLSTSFSSALRSDGATREPASSVAPVVTRVATEIADRVRQNQTQAVITLDPPELGRLRIMLTLDGDKVRAQIIAEVHESGNLIQNHLPELKEALQGHRLDLVDVHIDSGNRGGADSSPSQNFGREFGAERQWRGEREPADAANDRPSITRNQAAAKGSGQVSRWA